MKKYGCVLLSSCYGAIGYALTRSDSLILEPSEALDSELALPIRGFQRGKYQPETALGSALDQHFSRLGIYANGMRNVTALEPALAAFLAERAPSLRLLARPVSREGDLLTFTSVGGLETVGVERVLDLRETGDRALTVLYTTEDPLLPSRLEATRVLKDLLLPSTL